MIACCIVDPKHSLDMLNMILDYSKDKDIPEKLKIKVDDQDE